VLEYLIRTLNEVGLRQLGEALQLGKILHRFREAMPIRPTAVERDFGETVSPDVIELFNLVLLDGNPAGLRRIRLYLLSQDDLTAREQYGSKYGSNHVPYGTGPT